MRHIHLRDPNVPKTAIHYILGLQDWQLTDDESKVNCKMCRKMMERRRRHVAKEGDEGK